MGEGILFTVGIVVVIWLWGALTAFLSFEIAAREGDYLPLNAKDRFLNAFAALIWPFWNIILVAVYIWARVVDFMVGDGKNKTL